MNKKSLILFFFGILIVTSVYFEFYGSSPLYEGVAEKIPFLGESEQVNDLVLYYNGSEDLGDIEVSPEYVKLVNVSADRIQRSYSGGNESYALSGLDGKTVLSFPADGEYLVLVSFELHDPQNRDSIIYNELREMKYVTPVDFSERDRLNITISSQSAEDGDTLIYSRDLDYQSPSRSLN